MKHASVVADCSGPSDKCRVARGRVVFLSVTAGLAISEFLGLCISGVTTGHFSVDQGIGLAAVVQGGVFVLAGFRGARWLFGGVVAATGVYGMLHLMGVSHDVNLHSVQVATQSAIRLVGATVLLSSRGVAAFSSAARDAAMRASRERRR